MARGLSLSIAVLGALIVSVASTSATAAPTPGNWYLAQDHAAAAQALLPATLTPIRVAVLDSGIDGGHPALSGSIVAARSFIGGSPLVDSNGHGTFVAGEIVALAAAAAAGPSRPSPVQLVIGRITAGGSIAPAVEARAIRWAVRQGARVINLSLGGLRDPRKPALDSYSPAEAAAVRYAIAHRATVVAAVGNGDEAPAMPWPYAAWPAALPHVIGVGATSPDGSVPAWSNRDPIHAELAAPGVDIVSTVPRALSSALPGCSDPGYSDCGPTEYQHAAGTSFAAPQVAAAAALLLSADPQLTPDQVAWALERSADDANPATGCTACPSGRDALTGWGTLDIARALQQLDQPLPPASPYEPTNDAGDQAYRLTAPAGSLTADLDYWENPRDVYRIHLTLGQRLRVRLSAETGGTVLALWRPGTVHLQASRHSERLVATSTALPLKRLHYRARQTGWYYLEVAVRARTNSAYTLSYAAGP